MKTIIKESNLMPPITINGIEFELVPVYTGEEKVIISWVQNEYYPYRYGYMLRPKQPIKKQVK